MKISIIVPIYNVESYLDACIASIVNQDYKNLEIILVNDGSPDNSLEIATQWAEKDSRIIIINKKNGGLSSARNAGIPVATGDYLLFVDSDDTVSKLLSALLFKLNTLPKHDIIIGHYNRIYLNHHVIEGNNSSLVENSYNATDKVKAILMEKTNGLHPVWKNIISREFITSNNLYFKEGFIHEDMDWTIRMIIKLKSFYYTTDWWYNYVSERPGSIMNSIGLRSINNVCDICYEIINSDDFDSLSGNLRLSIKRSFSKSIYTTFRYYHNLNLEDKKSALKSYDKIHCLLKYSKKLKHKAFYLLSKIIGSKSLLNLMKVFNIS